MMNTDIAGVLSKDIQRLQQEITQMQEVLGVFLQAQQLANEVTEERLSKLEGASGNTGVTGASQAPIRNNAQIRTDEQGKEL